MSEHAWVHENLNSYAAGGLSPDERGQVEKHLAECEACRVELAECQRLDASMERLFAEVRPEPGFENRLLQKLRSAPWRRASSALRWVAAAAAMVFLGGIGALFHAAASDGRLAMPGTSKSDVTSGARALFGFLSGSNDRDVKQNDAAIKESLSLGDITEGKEGFTPAGETKGWQNIEEKQKELGELASRINEWKLEDLQSSATLNFFIRDTSSDGKHTKSLDESKWYRMLGSDLGKNQFGLAITDNTTSAATSTNGRHLWRDSGKSLGAQKENQRGLRPPTELPPPKVTTFDDNAKKWNDKNVPSDSLERKPAERAGVTPESGILALSRPAITAPAYYTPVEVREFLGQKILETYGRSAQQAKEEAPGKSEPRKESQGKSIEDDKAKANKEAEKKPDGEQPAVAARKIIRTGEVEFEVEIFDDTVASISKLINAVKGGFIATVNSDKLPNGKVKGSIVVRMPPEYLDKFLLDLRRELSKTGELKGQRIGSQDVTKSYTDVESRLRAARAMEERFITIIKTGKGEIKDLIAAERELGIWRTKIEEMEGEIRFYNNQIGLSTLTITAYEKEIQSAATIVIRETVGMRIEVEDVEKAQQVALKAVADLKGRVVKSDLKSHAAGQLESVLVFEVAPASAITLRDKLKALGQVTQMDSQRTQSAEGGKQNVTEAKSRTSDVQFNVSLYNAANIQPRESWILQVAALDVPGAYRQLQEAVAKAKGHVRVGSVNENDKLNITAQLDLDLPTTERKAFEDALAKAGTVISRSSTQAAVGAAVTDSKVGYRLTLRNVANIQPRETWTMNVATLDVPGSYRVLQEAVAQAKGHVRAGQVNEVDKLNITAQFDFDIPTSERRAFDEVLAKVGPVLTRNSTQAAAGENVTDRNVGYRLTIRNASAMQPRERAALAVEVLDVEKTAAELLELVKGQKGLVSGAKLSHEKSGRVTATMVFDVPLTAKDTLVRAVKTSGTVRLQESSRNANVPESELATAQIEVVLASNLPIVPSDEGLWPQIRTSLSYSFQLLSYSLMLIILGICVVLPWVLILWVVWKIYSRATKSPSA